MKALFLTLIFAIPALANTKPNIIIYLADDLGFGDLACYGNPIIQTPHLDAFAKEGVRLTDCHSAGTVCSPSRAGLLTGRAPYRAGFYTISGPEGCHLRKEELTIATLLRQRGYDTCFVGKWHLSHFNRQPNPGDHGFDHWFGTAVNAFDGPEDTDRWVRNGIKLGKVGKWYCEAITDEAISWIENRPDQSKPYFLFVCSHEPHTPIRPPAKYSDLYDNLDTKIQERIVNYGGIHRPLERDITPNKKYYYGTVTQLDATFGRLMKAIDDQGDREDSLVVFTSDNGPETPVTVEESGNQWKDPIRDRCFGTPGPWRGMKRFVYEGGHRVPGIVRWPHKVKPGTLSEQLVNGTDWFTTACVAAGIPIPDDRTIDGIDATPALLGQPAERPIPASWTFPTNYDPHMHGSISMRQKDQVIVARMTPKQKKENADQWVGHSAWVHSASLEGFELYDLSVDRSQNYPLNNTRPKEFERLKNEINTLWEDIKKEAPDWPALYPQKK